MTSAFTLEAADNLTVECTATLGIALTYSFRYGIVGEQGVRRSRGTFINTSPIQVIAPLAANTSAVVKSFTIRNPNAGDATVIIRINGVEEIRCTLNANNTLTEKGVFDANGQIRSIGAAGTSPVIIRTSTTSRTIGLGAVTFTTNNITNGGWIQGMRIRVAVTASPATNWMEGLISAAVTATSVTVLVDRIGGSGTFAAWSLGIAAENATVLVANSTDTIAIGTGAKTLNFPSAIIAIGWTIGTRLRFAADENNYMDGNVTAVSPTSVTIDAEVEVGTGSFSQWGISITGERGATGGQGNPGATGDTGEQGFNFLSGAGAPSNGHGNNGDSYLNTTNGDTYAKSAGTWTVNGNIKGTPGGAETVSPISALPIDWATGKIQRLAMSADLAPTPTDFQNPQSGFAHVIILTNGSGALRTFTLPTNAAHFTPATRGVTVADGKRRTLSAIYDGTSYHWAVGEELQNN